LRYIRGGMVDKSRKKRLLLPVAVVVPLLVIWVFTSGWLLPSEVQSTEILMDTTVTVKIYVRDKKRGERLIREAFDEARRIERIMEPLKGDGELKRLNNRTRDGWWVISPELREVLEESYKYYELSGGAFDPTIAPVKWLWGFDEGGHVPAEEDLREKSKLVGMSTIELRGDSLLFRNLGTKLDLGGAAKGYAVDRMIQKLRATGVHSILVNAGGDIATYGKKPGGRDWVIGLRHPRLNRTMVLAENPYPAVATSGDYQRYFIENGVRYHHILDPATGRPARGCISVTVWATSAMTADILSTTIFVLGPERGVAFAESLDNVETYIFYEKDGKVETVMSSGIRGRIGI